MPVLLKNLPTLFDNLKSQVAGQIQRVLNDRQVLKDSRYW